LDWLDCRDVRTLGWGGELRGDYWEASWDWGYRGDGEEWDKIMAVNLTGMFYSLRAELKVIKDRGSIVNIASIQGLMGEFPIFHVIFILH
jgi:NAD(P)-dependent dehydrogenase (short-subunit alcohol dehydrogenase family)